MKTQLLHKVVAFLKKHYRPNQEEQEMNDDHLYIKAYELLFGTNLTCEEKENLLDKAYQIVENQ